MKTTSNTEEMNTPQSLLDVLREQKAIKMKGGIYHKTQIDLTYNSNHIEGSRLTHEQTRYIFETNTIGVRADEMVNVNDIVETVNHFRCIDLIIDKAEEPLSEELMKTLHSILKSGTTDSRKDWFAVGDYKRLPNEVGGDATCEPEQVHDSMARLLAWFNSKPQHTLEDILDLHVRFEKIHPFQDGNGRVGRLIMFKECLHSGIVPFIITDELKMFYYRGIREWGHIDGYLTDTCLTAQDQYKAALDYFRIKY
jgi:Fic family protein